MTYTVQDSQGITFGVFNDLAKAKVALQDHAEAICNYPAVHDVLHLIPNAETISTVVSIIFDGGLIWESDLEGFTIIQWYQENGNY